MDRTWALRYEENFYLSDDPNYDLFKVRCQMVIKIKVLVDVENFWGSKSVKEEINQHDADFTKNFLKLKNGR